MTSNTAKSTLLKGGILLTHSSDSPPLVIPLFGHDLLIRDGIIAEVGQGLASGGADTQVIDCTGKIISPGFINTHAHLWQSQLKGRFSEDTLFNYMPRGNFAGFIFTPSDTYIGQLCGCLESLDGGTTTVLDHAHGCHTTAHIEQAVQATIDSGIRAVWAYSEPVRLSKWDHEVCEPSYDYWNEQSTACVEGLAKKLNTTHGRVEIGLAFDLWFLPKEMITPLFQRLTAAGVRTLTTHIGRDVLQGLGLPITNIQTTQEVFDASKQYLGVQNLVASHALNLPEDQLELMKDLRQKGLNVSISATPTTESAMCMHRTPAFHSAFSKPPHHSVVSLGVDCHCAGISYLPTIGTMLLNSVRIQSNEKYYVRDEYPMKMRGTSQEIFNMMTVYGAQALGLDSKDGGIGRLEVGRRADIVVIDTDRPGIGVAAQHNPVDALLGFSGNGDVEYVFVDGEAVKWEGKLLPVKRQDGKTMDWKHIKQELSQSYQDIEKKWLVLNMEKATEMMVGLWHVDASKFVAGEQ